MNLNKMIQGLMTSGIGGGLAGGLASGLLVNAVGNKKVGKVAGSAAKLGGAAVVGALAWKAYENYRDKGKADTGQSRIGQDWSQLDAQTFMPAEHQQVEKRDLLLLRAMITAAHADGHINRQERSRIFQRIEALELDADEKSLLFDEILMPRPMQQLVADIHEPAMAAEAYLASLLVLDTGNAASRSYLADLAEQLMLPAELVRSLHEQARQSQAPVALPAQAYPPNPISPLA